MKRFQDKYRIPSARLKNWDYGCNGSYFITICTQNRDNYFGKIVIVETPNLGVSTITSNIMTHMQLSEIGKIVYHYWNEIPNHFPFVELGEFVVMPNHIHGIITIDKTHIDGSPSV